ncbi:hypothetical protein DB346_09515 [Verrucomicrobia bacterium LW23]|nr:hypothetical protein DB346_09515 [Verrucomicrobia bacterium LW23]
MPEPPRRVSLVHQTVVALQDAIARQTWREWLPAERELTAAMCISRNTLRAALRSLAAAGIIQIIPRSGCRILLQAPVPGRIPQVPPRKALTIGLLCPIAPGDLRPVAFRWISHLRNILQEKGIHLELHHGAQYCHTGSVSALERLVQSREHTCWILALSNRTTQKWFCDNHLPCIIAGSAHKGITLPSVDVDHRAVCRHAVGVLLAHGHRRMAWLGPTPVYGGDLESDAGIAEGVENSGHTDATVQTCRYQPTPAGVATTVRRLMRSPNRPTALLIAHSHFYLTVATELARMGLRVAKDVSLICRDSDPFLTFVVPAPARYEIDAMQYARTLFKMLNEHDFGALSIASGTVRIFPQHIAGESITNLPLTA